MNQGSASNPPVFVPPEPHAQRPAGSSFLRNADIYGIIAALVALVVKVLQQILVGDADEPNFRLAFWTFLSMGIAGLMVPVVRDLSRFSFTRVWAISSVGYRESIRRKVLWVTPLAMLGIIAVSQLAHPFDHQDDIRQRIKFCLFGTSLILVMTTLIAACTNLPREIENRVIYTVVTKPVTRLEIMLGKVLGFARTSGLILLLMGGFSYGYLRISAHQRIAEADFEHKSRAPSGLRKATLEHYLSAGLLNARSYADPADLQVYASVPQPNDPVRWILGGNEQLVQFPISVPDFIFESPDFAPQIDILLQLEVWQRPLNKREVEENQHYLQAYSELNPLAYPLPPRPSVDISIADQKGYGLIQMPDLFDQVNRAKPANGVNIRLEPVKGMGNRYYAMISILPKEMVDKLAMTPSVNGARQVWVQIIGTTLATRYGFDDQSVQASVQFLSITGRSETRQTVLKPWGPQGEKTRPGFIGRLSQARLQQIRGAQDPDDTMVAVYSFKDTHLERTGDLATLEMRLKIERSGDEATEMENSTLMELTVVNRTTGKATAPIPFAPESFRPVTIKVPWEAVSSGQFDIHFRVAAEGHYAGIRLNSLTAVSATHSFGINLVKSLLVLWLLSILVTIISILCSTFVSWPIAVVLSLFLLLGRWVVEQVGDFTPQQVASGIFNPRASPVGAKIFTETLGALTQTLKGLAKVLPDVSRFSVSEDIARGVDMPLQSLLGPLGIIALYGLPMLLLAYVFFRRKEVAP